MQTKRILNIDAQNPNAKTAFTVAPRGGLAFESLPESPQQYPSLSQSDQFRHSELIDTTDKDRHIPAMT